MRKTLALLLSLLILFPSLANAAVNRVDGTSGQIVVSPTTGDVVVSIPDPLNLVNLNATIFRRDFTSTVTTAQSAMQLGLGGSANEGVGGGPSLLFFGQDSAGQKEFLGRLSAIFENATDGSEQGALVFSVRASAGDTSAATAAMRITHGGDVGIGTDSPSVRFHVKGTSSAHAYIRADADAALQAAVEFAKAGAQKWVEYVPGSSDDLRFYDGTADRVTLKSGGSVGIGTTSPDGVQVNVAVSETARGVDNVRFGVLSGTPRVIFEDAGQTQMEIDNTAGRLRIFSPGVEHMAVQGSTGNVGIGTTTPRTKLDIVKSVSGSRVDGGTISIPAGLYGTGTGAQTAKTLVPGLLVDVSDSTTYNSDVTDHDGAVSATVVINSVFGSAYNGLAHGLIVQSKDDRSIGAVTLPVEQDLFNVQSLVVANQTVNGGASFPGAPRVNTVGYYAHVARLTANNWVSGGTYVINNFVDDREAYGLQLVSGDGTNVGTEYTAGDAIRVTNRNSRNTVDAWVNAFNVVNASLASVFRVANNGDLVLAALAGGGATNACIDNNGKVYRQSGGAC